VKVLSGGEEVVGGDRTEYVEAIEVPAVDLN
jgi:hypothetical protein